MLLLKGLGDTYLFRKDERVGKEFRDNIKKIDWKNDLVSFEYFKNDKSISFCYKEEESLEKTTAEIIRNFAKK